MFAQRFFTPPATQKDWWSSFFAALELTANIPHTVYPAFAIQPLLSPDAGQTETAKQADEGQALARSRCCLTA
jgi:hypothetical protein